MLSDTDKLMITFLFGVGKFLKGFNSSDFKGIIRLPWALGKEQII
jgi:hypothetical protein